MSLALAVPLITLAHHAHPRSAKFSVRRRQFDPAWPIIRSLAAAGLLDVLGPPGA